MVKKIMLAIIVCFILLSALPSSAAQWSTCSIDRVGASAIGGDVYIRLTWVSGGDSWEGSRTFVVNPDFRNQFLAIFLAAQSNGSNVLVNLADIVDLSLINKLYILSD